MAIGTAHHAAQFGLARTRRDPQMKEACLAQAAVEGVDQSMMGMMSQAVSRAVKAMSSNVRMGILCKWVETRYTTPDSEGIVICMRIVPILVVN